MDAGDIAITVGTGLVSGVAGGVATVFGTNWRATQRSPKLTMRESRFTRVRASDHATRFPSLWLQFVVANTGNGDSAEDVSVMLTSVNRRGGVAVDIEPTPLKWSGLGSSKVNISSSSQRNIDVAHVLWPPKPDDGWAPPWPPTAADRTEGALVIGLWPRDEHDSRVVLEPGEYSLELELVARDVRPTRYEATIELCSLLTVAWKHAEDPQSLLASPLNASLSDGKALRVVGPTLAPLARSSR
jgi:hypothetical protein